MSEFTEAQREEIKQVVIEALSEWIKSYGILGKNIIVGLAATLLALAVIGKGIGWLLALIGFTYIK